MLATSTIDMRCLAALVAFSFLASSSFAISPTQIVKRNLIDEKTVAGTIVGVETSQARARLGGTINTLHTERGSWVKKGQLLATIDDSKLPGQLSTAEQQLQAAKSRVQLAQINLQRMQSLLPLDAASPLQVEQAQAQYQTALADLASAQNHADTRILAPQDGLLTELSVISGSVVMPGETLATIAVQPLLVRLELPERHAQLIALGDEVSLSISSTTLNGKVSRIYPSISNGRLTVDISTDGLESMKVGEKILARVKVGTHQGIVLPQNYLIARNSLTFVKLQSGSEVVIQPGSKREDGTVEILSGLNVGDIVVQP